MEPGYLHLNWNHIPGMYCRKSYLRSLVIKQEEWDHLSDPAHLANYREPTQEPGDFHQTFTLVLFRSKYSNCDEVSHREESVLSVAMIRKPACLAGIPFTSAAEEFSDPTKKESILLLVQLHCHSQLFLDIYFDWYGSHFTMMHVSSVQYNVGHPQKYVGALLHNAYEAWGKTKSQRLNFLQSLLTTTYTSSLLISVRSCTRIGPQGSGKELYRLNTSSFYQRRLCRSALTPGNHTFRRISHWALQMLVTGWHGPERCPGFWIPKNILSWSTQALTLLAQCSG